MGIFTGAEGFGAAEAGIGAAEAETATLGVDAGGETGC